MARNKFTKSSEGSSPKAQSLLAAKLDLIACGLADEVLGRASSLSEGLNFDDKLGALKTLTTYYAMVAKVEPPEELGNGFATYRNAVTTSSDGRDATGGGGIDLSGEVE